MNADVLREYLLSLGWKVDEGSWRKFNSAVERTTRSVVELGAETVATGLAISAMVERIARQYEDLFYISQRTGTSVSNLKAYGFAARQVGISTEGMTAAIESFAAAQRMNPGIVGLVRQFTTATDRAEQLVDVVAGLRQRFGEQGYFAAARVASIVGLDEPTFRMLWMNLERLKTAQADQKKIMADAGMDADKAAGQFTDFARDVNKLQEQFAVLGQRIAHDFLPYVHTAVRAMSELMTMFLRFNAATGGAPGVAGTIATGALGVYVTKRLAARLLGWSTGAAAGAAGAGGAAAGTAGAAVAGRTAASVGLSAGAGVSALGVLGPLAAAAALKQAQRSDWEGSEIGRAMHEFRYGFRKRFGLEQDPDDERVFGGGKAGAPKLSSADRDTLIRTVVGEAATQSDIGQAAVAAVVLNRLKSGRYGANLGEVVTAPGQFEPWNTRRAELLGLSRDNPAYRRAAENVDSILSGSVADPTGGAFNFANESTVATRGNMHALSWIEEMRRNGSATRIGDHVFGTPDSRPGAVSPPLAPGAGEGATTNVILNQHTDIKVEAGPTPEATGSAVLQGQDRVNGDAVRNLGAKVR